MTPTTIEARAILACARSLRAEALDRDAINEPVVRSMIADSCRSMKLDAAEELRILCDVFPLECSACGDELGESALARVFEDPDAAPLCQRCHDEEAAYEGEPCN